MNYYPFHIGDYVSATRHLSWEEDAAYRRLLDTYYTTEKPLPADLRAVCRLVLATTEAQREAVRVVLEEFFERADDGWRNSRADAEISAMREKQQKQREKAQKRWQKPAPDSGNAPAMPRHEESDAAASKPDADAMPPTPTPTPEDISDEANASSSSAGPTGGKPGIVPCPYDRIVSAYHEILPMLPAVRLKTDARQKAMRKLWAWVLTSTKTDGSRRATTADEAVEWLRAYFARAAENDFLMGRNGRSGEHANWTADFDFLLTERGMKHVIERTEAQAA